jgi:maleate isomerase
MTEIHRRIGLIVPSSNTTMETEVPALIRRLAPGASFSFHGARVRMREVRQDELEHMNADAGRAMTELMDAPLDAVAYACLVAIMAMGNGYHRTAEAALSAIGPGVPCITSAGALVEELRLAGAQRVALVMPYADALARRVADYIEAEGFTVADYVNLRVTDNAAVGRIPGSTVLSALDRLNTAGVDQVVLSCCVQMPSAAVLDEAAARLGGRVTSAALCTSRQLLRRLDVAMADDLPIAAAA